MTIDAEVDAAIAEDRVVFSEFVATFSLKALPGKSWDGESLRYNLVSEREERGRWHAKCSLGLSFHEALALPITALSLPAQPARVIGIATPRRKGVRLGSFRGWAKRCVLRGAWGSW